jgi:hypothetical protein
LLLLPVTDALLALLYLAGQPGAAVLGCMA